MWLFKSWKISGRHWKTMTPEMFFLRIRCRATQTHTHTHTHTNAHTHTCTHTRMHSHTHKHTHTRTHTHTHTHTRLLEVNFTACRLMTEMSSSWHQCSSLHRSDYSLLKSNPTPTILTQKQLRPWRNIEHCSPNRKQSSYILYSHGKWQN